MSVIDTSDAGLAALERGSELLGCGGGGPTPLARTLLRQAIWRGQPPVVQSLACLGDDDPVLPVGIVGATGALREKLPSGSEFVRVVDSVTRVTGVSPRALVGTEVGGVNGLMVLVAAADTGIDAVDADLMGRALPRLDQFTAAVYGCRLTPAALAGGTGASIVLDDLDAHGVERVARLFLAESGGWAAMACAPIPAGVLREAAAVGSFSHAQWLGRVQLDAQIPDPAGLADELGGRIHASGLVEDVVRYQGASMFSRGVVTLADHETQALIRIDMENEYLTVLRDGVPVASTPDIICVVERRTAVPVPCDRIRYGMDVSVLHLPGASFWRRPRHLPAVAPRAFGIDVDACLMPGAFGVAP
ncbi:DUF917 domain-containing protein [Haloactinopolyspora sp.]|uniref:DUF917 domain-containing protein n=1 Tax=Haloactinopolyspora sp. TaxID=1966353 RepID=UPI00262CF777|nr:DUF917 domain-containing protein [Haloactinopolyspora sp.]